MLLTQKSEKISVSQFSVLSSQFSVLSSQFSVLSSLGEEYTDSKYTIVENLQRGQTSAWRRSVPFVVLNLSFRLKRSEMEKSFSHCD